MEGISNGIQKKDCGFQLPLAVSEPYTDCREMSPWCLLFLPAGGNSLSAPSPPRGGRGMAS